MVSPRLLGALSLPLLAIFGCSGDATSEVPLEDESALATANANGTSVEAEANDSGVVGRFTFELTKKNGKRVAVVHAKRGRAKADLECSQLTNFKTDRRQDEIVTLCEEQIRPGSEYVSVYFRYRPATQKWSYDVIASHPTLLTAHQNELYELFVGSKVTEPPPPANAGRDYAHRAEKDNAFLTEKAMSTEPFADPIALAVALHPGLRGGIGAKGTDRWRAPAVEFKVEQLTMFSEFDTLVYTANLGGRSTDGGWRNGRNVTVSVAASPTTLATSEKISADLRAAIEAL